MAHRSRDFLMVGSVAVLALAAACSADNTVVSGGNEGGAGNGPDTTETGGTGGGGAADAKTERSDVPFDAATDLTDDEYARFLGNLADFGFDIFGSIAEPNDNTVFSPLSVGVALGMVYAGARGDTATQMATAMHHDLDPERLHVGYNQVTLDMQSWNVAPEPRDEDQRSLLVSLANSTWVQDGYPVVPSYLDLLSARYDSALWLVDFMGAPEAARQSINTWVADETQQRIQDLIPPGAITPITRLVLANALYFKANWASDFSSDATDEGTFSTLSGSSVSAQMMHKTTNLAYADGNGYVAVELPFVDSHVKMTLVLPDEGSFDTVRDAFSSEWLATLDAQITSERVALALPKFEFTWGTESLTPVLQALGIEDAFLVSVADFSGIEPTRELFISDVVHQAFIAVDEEGAEAAAATAVVMDGSGMPVEPPTPIPVTLDRPFFFLIRSPAGHLLFVGQVMEP